MYLCVDCQEWLDNDYVVCHEAEGGLRCDYCEGERTASE